MFGALVFSAGVALSGALFASAQTSAASPCATDFGYHAPGDGPCAVVDRTLRARVLAHYPPSLFGGNHVTSFALLRDGTVMVGTDEQGLFRIDGRGRMTTLWPPRDHCDGCHVTLFAPYVGGALAEYHYSWLVGVSTNGALADGPWTFADPAAMFDNVLGQDADGAVWLEGQTPAGQRIVYILNPATKAIQSIPGATFYGAQIFISIDGHAYSRNEKVGITELRGLPTFQERFIHAPLPSPPPSPIGTDGLTRTFFVAPDGSCWGSTATQILHLHVDGRLAVIRLAPPMLRGCIACGYRPRMAPDGSVFMFLANHAIHVTLADRVEVLDLPDIDRNGYYDYPTAFAPDGTLWYISIDDHAHLSSLVHVRY